MPYIRPVARDRIDDVIYDIPPDLSTGELNYLLTCVLYRYIKNRGGNYQAINDVIGVLGCVEHELYRRVAAPYEDAKIEENGDLDPPDTYQWPKL